MLNMVEVAKLAGCSRDVIRKRLVADEINHVGRKKVAKYFYTKDKANAFIAEWKKHKEENKKRAEKMKKNPTAQNGLSHRKKKEIRPHDDPYGVCIKPQYRGRMCRNCNKVEVPTGMLYCGKCRDKRSEAKTPRTDDNYIFC